MKTRIKIKDDFYGLILNGNYVSKKVADKFKKSIININKDTKTPLKISIRKYKDNKYVIYMKGAKGKKFTEKKGQDKY